MARLCDACRSQNANETYEHIDGMGICHPCLLARRRKQGIIALIVLAVVWSLFAAYLPRALNDDVSAYWQSARLIPALLVALYITIFVFRAAYFFATSSGIRKIGEAWAVDIRTANRRGNRA